jgi:hypothetical protein
MKKKLPKLRLTRETLLQLNMVKGGIPQGTDVCDPTESCVHCYPTGPQYCGYTEERCDYSTICSDLTGCGCG